MWRVFMKKKLLQAFFRQIRATTDEQTRTLPGDAFIPQPLGYVNHANTIHRPSHDVWPWLAQMGAGRAG